jgi:hypothetical protein
MSSDPDWLIERVEKPGPTHVLSFSDEIAHLREDLVVRAETFVREFPRVDAAHQEDREIIHLLAPDLDDRAFRAAFGAWWADVSREPPPWVDLQKAVATAAHSVLKPVGFRKRGNVFNRQTEEGLVQVVDLYRTGETVRVDVGLFLERARTLTAMGDAHQATPSWVGEPHCQIRGIEELRNHERAFRLDGDVEAVADYIRTHIIPVLERLRTVADLLDVSERGSKRIGWIGPEAVTFAAILSEDGDLVGARDLLQMEFERCLPRSRPSVLALADRLGVPALVTGKDPILSGLDEEILARWKDQLEHRIEELARVIESRPDLGRRTFSRRRWRPDGTPASLDHLWRWLVDAVPLVDSMFGEPDAMPGRYRGELGSISDGTASPAIAHLGELVASYVSAIIIDHHSHARWEISPAGDLQLATEGSFPVLARVQKELRWLIRIHREQGEIRRTGSNPLAGIVERGVAELG